MYIGASNFGVPKRLLWVYTHRLSLQTGFGLCISENGQVTSIDFAGSFGSTDLGLRTQDGGWCVFITLVFKFLTRRRS